MNDRSRSGLPPSCAGLDPERECDVALLISLCLSSPSLLSSSSESEPLSNASFKSLSASVVAGSSDRRRCRDAIEDALDRKEGGGEDGIGSWSFDVVGVIGISL